MKNGTFLFAGWLACALPLLNAQGQTRFNSQPGKSSVKVAGSSTFHDWEMEGRVIGGFIEVENGVQLDQAKGEIAGLKDSKLPAMVRANINVLTIHSEAEHLPDVMDHLMQKTLNAETYTSIRFTATSLALTKATPGKPFEFNAAGDLSISGVTNKVSFPVTIEQPDPAHLHVTGTAKLKMTDFKVDPPAPTVLGLGTMKCGDDITITFDWILQKRAAP